jgi:hypothetical protein
MENCIYRDKLPEATDVFLEALQHPDIRRKLNEVQLAELETIIRESAKAYLLIGDVYNAYMPPTLNEQSLGGASIQFYPVGQEYLKFIMGDTLEQVWSPHFLSLFSWAALYDHEDNPLRDEPDPIIDFPLKVELAKGF